jgi:hypothetical protein
MVPKNELMHLYTSMGCAVAGIFSNTEAKAGGIVLDAAIFLTKASNSCTVGRVLYINR